MEIKGNNRKKRKEPGQKNGRRKTNTNGRKKIVMERNKELIEVLVIFKSVIIKKTASWHFCEKMKRKKACLAQLCH